MLKNQKNPPLNQADLNFKQMTVYFPNDLQQKQYEEIRSAYKAISRFLIYMVKCSMFQLDTVYKLQSQLGHYVQCLDVIIKSLEYDKSGHLFSLFSYVRKKYQQLRKLGDVTQKRVYKRVQLNKSSPEYQEQKLSPISSRQKIFLKSSLFSNVSEEIALNQIVLQNPQCVCCSQVFIKNLQIFNYNPYFPIVIEMDTKISVDKVTIQKYANAVCNKGGGVVLFGVQNFDGAIKATGIKFKSYEQIQRKKSQICQAIQWIHPPCMYLVEHVLVHTNYIDQTNVGDQIFRVCFRIIVFPSFFSKINYTEVFIKGQQRSYEIYYFNKQQKISKLLPGQIKNPEKQQYLYTLIHNQYKMKKKNINSHANIMCYRPYLYCSKSFITLYNQGKITQEQMFPKNKDIKQEEMVVFSDEPKFKYKNCSLLIVNYKNKQREIDNFIGDLEEENYLIEVLKPFQKSFKQNNSRSLCLLSHDVSQSKIRCRLMKCEQQLIVEKSIIKMLPVSSILQIEQSKFGEDKQNAFKKKFSERYKQNYKCEQAESFDKKFKGEIKQLRFHDKIQSLYAYLILDQLQIRPFFVKQGFGHKKK